MEEIKKWIEGRKTFLGAIALFVAGGLHAVGLVDQKTFEAAAAIIGAWTAWGLRSAIRKIE